jgi:hypothetical protein
MQRKVGEMKLRQAALLGAEKLARAVQGQILFSDDESPRFQAPPRPVPRRNPSV